MNNQVKGINEILFQIFINLMLVFFTLCAVLPFLMVLSSSVSSEAALAKSGYGFLPKEFTVYAYRYLFSSNGIKILRAYGTTIAVTAAGTVLGLIIGPMFAWPLSRREYKKAKVLNFMVVFTMLFNGGIVPTYIMWTQIFQIKNTIWALIFPGLLLSSFHIILYRNYFATSIHHSLIDAAKIDGAGDLKIYLQVALPLSKPILCTVGLMTALRYWNDWMNGLYYITDTKLYNLQTLLNSIITNIKLLATGEFGPSSTANLPTTSIRMAMAVIGVIPVMIAYPMFQKHFIAGINLGGVKE